MSRKSLLVILTLGLLAGAPLLAGVDYPIKELGNCQNKVECKDYCDMTGHLEECLNFAKEHNLLLPSELAEAEKILQAAETGIEFPGDCQTKAECEAYCDTPSHMKECLDFAEKAGLIPARELKEARQVAKALAQGLSPPGNCRRKKECEAHCAQLSHMEECLEFAEAAGLIPADELAMAKKIMPLMMRGEMPGGCQSKEECETYCAQEDHGEECAAFAQKAGLMSEEELEKFRKTGGRGPGGCSSEEECDAFCNDPANQETCLQFALDHDLVSQEELQKIEEGRARLKESFAQANPETMQCIKSVVGEGKIEEIRAGTFLPTSGIGDEIRVCFEKHMAPPTEVPPTEPQPGEAPPGEVPRGERSPQAPPEGFIGPGGCSSVEECEAYCSDPAHVEECMKFQP